MLAVYGTFTACAGLLILFAMLSVIRRPGAAAWLKSRLTREGTVFASLLATSATVWKIRRPVPPEDMPAPALGFDPGPIGPQAPTRR